MSNSRKGRVSRLTLLEAEQTNDSRLFVLNKLKGNLNFTILATNGHKHNVRLMQTFIPVDMTQMAQRKDILVDAEFRRACDEGFIELIESKSADDFFAEHESARAERQRLRGNRTAVVKNTDKEIDIALPGVQDVNDVAKATTLANGVSAMANGFVGRANNMEAGSENANDIISDLTVRAAEMTTPDLEYILNNVTESTIKSAVASIISNGTLEV